jgi:putative transposase
LIKEFVEHYHSERNHQGLDNTLIDGNSQDTDGLGPVARRERLGGLLSFYYREAA